MSLASQVQMRSTRDMTESLHEQIGGAESVDELVVGFYQRVFSDPDLRPFFDGVSADKLTAMQREFFAGALGGPEQYSGGSLRDVHEGRGITPREMSKFTGHLLATLEAMDLAPTTVSGIVNRIARHADDITGLGGEDG